MGRHASKNFIATALGVVLAMSGLTWLSDRAEQVKDTPTAMAQSVALAQPVAQAQTNNEAQPVANDPAAANDPNLPSYDQGYRAGYQDGHRDCQASQSVARGTTTRRTYSTYRSYRSYRGGRSGVAGARYYAERRRGHSTRDLILTIAAPAAIGAGIGALAGGKKGAGIGALLGGGGGALYHLIKKRRR
jgi:hypothetical protein